MSSAPVMAGAGLLHVLGTDYATSRGVLVTGNGGGGANYGSYVELSAALPYDTAAIHLLFEGSNVGVRGYFRLAIGAAGSEVVIANDIPASYSTSQGDECILPLALPKGARLSIGVRHDFARTVRVTALLTPAHPWYPVGYRYAVGIGSWATLDAGGTAHTMSAYADHTTNLAAGIKALQFVIATNGTDNTSYVLADLEYDGLVIGTLAMEFNGFQFHGPKRLTVPGAFAAGKTVRSRHQSSGTAASSGRNIAHALIGLG